MSKSSYLYIFFVVLFLLVACSQGNNSTSFNNEETDTVALHSTMKPKVVNLPDPYSIQTIGEIHLGISKEDFIKAKNAFLAKHQDLNGLSIKEIRGFFNEGKLERILVISEKTLTTFYYNKKDEQRRPNEWQVLYQDKYGSFNFVKNGVVFSVHRRRSLPKVNSVIFEIIENENASFAELRPTPYASPLDIVDGIGPHETDYGYVVIDIYNQIVYNKLTKEHDESIERARQKKREKDLDAI